MPLLTKEKKPKALDSRAEVFEKVLRDRHFSLSCAAKGPVVRHQMNREIKENYPQYKPIGDRPFRNLKRALNMREWKQDALILATEDDGYWLCRDEAEYKYWRAMYLYVHLKPIADLIKITDRKFYGDAWTGQMSLFDIPETKPLRPPRREKL